ncbi:MAG: hypothetical protein F4X11_01830 [Acidobacteria bacterium]|nr:hypothetical protein [Acidobacteriota bacterium]
MPRLVPLAAGVLLLTAASIRSQEPTEAPGEDDALRAALTAAAERIVLPERCGECHAAEFDVWETTEHATGFDTLHRRDRAKEIYRNLDLRLIKRGTDETTPACLSCHYTPVLRRDQLRAGAGVTCESCHGPARDWISIHNSYGVAEADFQKAALLETPGHRMQRVADSRAAGMRRPSDLYDVAANCFGCHTVPNENLVNRGGHSTGSDFEIVAWSERIRHNFLESYKTADGRTNAERPTEWKRRMYVVGRMLDLEYAVRGVAAATRNDELYFGAMSDRAKAAVDELLEINERVALPAVQKIIATWNAIDLTLGMDPLSAAAAMQESTKQFIASSDGVALAALDPLWDPTAEDVEAVAPARVTEIPDLPVSLPAPTREDAGAVAAELTRRDDRGSLSTAAPAPGAELLALNVPPARAEIPAPSPPRAAAPAPPPPAVAIETLTRPPWRAPPDHAFVRVPCGRCHNSQERWWRKDPHSATAKPFHANAPRNAEIAEAYGVAAGDMAKGDQVCMWCHGTPVSRPSRKVRAGVGCQRCHGAGADYIEPHETIGYAASLDLGLTDLRDPAVQAATCAGCHYITDPGLIAAGHPVGDGFEMRSRIDDIVHWGAAFGRETQPVDRDLLAAAYTRVAADRGPAPVPAATQPSTVAPPTSAATVPAAASGPQRTSARLSTQRPAPREPARGPTTGPGRPTPPARTAVQTVRPPRSAAVPVLSASRSRQRSRRTPTLVADPGLAELRPDANGSVEETLDVLRERIESLYNALAT